jgi:uroporphyrinogen-III decarboxylase
MDEKERLWRALRFESVDRVPCISPMQTATIERMKASAWYWPDAHRDPEKMANLALAANRFAGLENARVPFEVA